MDVRTKLATRYEGPCHVLDHSRIEVGDILLSTSEAWVSSAIKVVTRSAFSHAAIFVQAGGLVIEAVHPHIKLTSMVDKAIRDAKNIRVLRWANPQMPCNTQAIAEYARSHVFKNYSRSGAVLSKAAQGWGTEEESQLFCSQLIASSYLAGGVSLTDKAPAKTTPADIAKSPYLLDVTQSVLLPAHTSDLMVERFVEQGSDADMGTEFHALVKGIVDATVGGCPFIKKGKLKSLEEVIGLLIAPERSLEPAQEQVLIRQFSLAVGGRLDHFLERWVQTHAGAAFSYDAIIDAVIEGGFCTNGQLRQHLVFLESLNSQAIQGLAWRVQSLEFMKQVPPSVATLPVIKGIERFYQRLFSIETQLFDVGMIATERLRAHLKHSGASSETPTG
ncbi:YiiX/YebB-like N1pC/P60 family cysteine hydrolase [uncultured Pseudomonas sp.]|uniref:YiiX/YebB-like N1pC/P60 family cysteine hydrolase n=1 Tax=uncultured Pseudomonas sp. TaxID=114707 RepID=UPI0025FF003B|nr:YiiX/YebB-like N1pC/P60 family cysteine hydrolase [uncultured Pseudomonas sp.]